jgi:hypothetical protein
MADRNRWLAVVAGVLGIALVASAAPEPSRGITDDGRTFLYRARPGDSPGKVAEMFGVPPSELPAWLSAGVVYRVPNVAARTLAERLGAVERENAALAAAAGRAETRARDLLHESEALRRTTTAAEARAARASRLVTFWPLVEGVLLLLTVLGGCALHFAYTALRAKQHAEHQTHVLAQELDDKRSAALAERQQSGRRIIDLETRIRELEARLGPRVVVGGRGQ